MMEATEQQDGGEERTGKNEESESDAAHDTGASAAAQVAEDEGDSPSCAAAATAPKRPQSATEVARIVQELGKKAEEAPAEAAPRGSAGGGSEQVAATQGEEGRCERHASRNW